MKGFLWRVDRAVPSRPLIKISSCGVEEPTMTTIKGTSGNDTITLSSVSPGVTGDIPSDDPDIINGQGNALIDSGGGNDALIASRASDILNGGDGDDIFQVPPTPTPPPTPPPSSAARALKPSSPPALAITSTWKASPPPTPPSDGTATTQASSVPTTLTSSNLFHTTLSRAGPSVPHARWVTPNEDRH